MRGCVAVLLILILAPLTLCMAALGSPSERGLVPFLLLATVVILVWAVAPRGSGPKNAAKSEKGVGDERPSGERDHEQR